MERKADFEMVLGGVDIIGMKNLPMYPAWRYHKILQPVLVNDTSEDQAIMAKGYDDPLAPMTANKQVINWFWDLEDMSPRQLVVFAKEEFEVDLPVEASQESLFKAVCELSKHSPQNRGRLIFMAHEIKMNYEATLAEIKRQVEKYDADVTRWVVEI